MRPTKFEQRVIVAVVAVLALAMGPDVASASPVISGRITADACGVEAVVVSADNGGGSDTTDPNGYYALTVPSAWSGIVTPNMPRWAFEPNQRSYDNVTVDQNDQDYTAFAPPIISGYVTGAGYGIEAVIVSADNGGYAATTDSNGFYHFSVPDGWSGTVTPSKIGMFFTPESRSYAEVTADQNEQNYAESPRPPVALSRTVSGAYDDTYYDLGTFYWLYSVSSYLRVGKYWAGLYHYCKSGMRFRNVDIPSEAAVDSAYLRLRTASGGAGDLSGEIRGEASDNPSDFHDPPIFERPETSASVSWSHPQDEWVAGQWRSSPDISVILRQIMSRQGWSSGNSMVLFYGRRRGSDPGDRFFYSYDGGHAPQLEITFRPAAYIAGYVRDQGSVGVEGVVVTASDGGTSGTTDATGYYQIRVPPEWSGEVTPTKDYWVFEPPQRPYTNLYSDRENQNFAALPPLIISGTIADSNGIADVSVLLSADNRGGSDTTDVNGHYELPVPHGWSGAVTPSKTGRRFDPNIRSYETVIADRPDQDYLSFRPAIISLSPLAFCFVTTDGGLPPDDQILRISNEGPTTLRWAVVTPNDCNWLTAYPVAGDCLGEVDEVVLKVDTAGLDYGYYSCNLAIIDPNAENSPQIVQPVLAVLRTEGRLHVPSEFPTIQQAIEFGADGDQVIVEPNTYTGPGNVNIDFLGKAITVRSIDPNDPNVVASTIIDCNYQADGFYFHSGEGPNSVVDGLTIARAGLYQSAVYCVNTGPTIRNCTIADCLYDGIYFWDSDPTILNCNISGNSGAGIWGYSLGRTIRISNCIVNANGYGGIKCSDGGTVTISGCSIKNNSGWLGGGVGTWPGELGPGPDVEINGCTISGNTAEYGGGVCCTDGNCTITESTISGNVATEYGGGVCFGGDDYWWVGPVNATLSNCRIADNAAGVNGGGVYLGETTTGTISECEIHSNTAGDKGGGVFFDPGILTITGCTISQNSASWWGGGIFYNGRGDLPITHCIISSNTATNGAALWVARESLHNCTIMGNQGYTLFGVHSSQSVLRNSIIWGNRVYQLRVSIEYSCVDAGHEGLGNIDVDPCFAVPGFWDPNGTPEDANDDFWVDGDYHLKSQAGRWQPSLYAELDPESDHFVDLSDYAAFASYWQMRGGFVPADFDHSGVVDSADLAVLLNNYLSDYGPGEWVFDDVTSSLIDAGNPGCPLADEPNDPNNIRINMGTYGGTTEASKSPAGWGILADLNNDLAVDPNDISVFVDYWLSSGQCIPSDLNRSGSVRFDDFAFFAADWAWQP